jgi:cytochrome P450
MPPVASAANELREIGQTGYRPVDTMLTADPPIQTRYRKAAGKAFSTRRIQSFEPRIREITDELFDALPDQGRVNVMHALAVPIPVRVIAHMLSIPEERSADVKRWSDDSVASIGVSISKQRAIEAGRSIVELQHFLAELISQRQTSPRDDFLSELADADFEDESGEIRKLEIPEMLSIVQQLMVAGNETTTKALNEMVRLLIENPLEWKRVQEDPGVIPKVVEEGLRLASPNQGLFRVASEDTELEGVPIPKGARLWVMFGSANRDERVFPDPDRFDSSRENLNEAVTFGRGAHFCIGAPLARLEIRVFVEQLARRVESMALAPGATLEYEPSFILRGLKSLEIEMVKRARGRR